MTIKEIEDILLRYEEGKTTLREERLLQEFFQKNIDVPPHLRSYRSFFRFTACEKKEGTSPAFDMLLRTKLDQQSLDDRFFRQKRVTYYSLAIIACIILLVSMLFTFRLSLFPDEQPYGTITDPQLAYIETRNALIRVSEKLNQGLDQMQPLEYFSFGMKQAQRLSQYDKYQPIIFNPDDHTK